MKYKYILLDVDNTLLDISAAEKVAHKNASLKFSLPATQENYLTYKKINAKWWKKHELLQCSREELVIKRFEEYLPLINATHIDAKEFNSCFLNELQYTNVLMEGATELVKYLYDLGSTLYIVTNGFYKVQKNRLKDLELTKFIKDVFVSENVGFAKPTIEFFKEVEKRIGDNLKGKSLIIGDSLTSDIQGGMNIGIDTCLYNPENLEIPNNFKVDYNIQKLTDLIKILN